MLPSLMTQVAREELNKLSNAIEECSIIYVPQVWTIHANAKLYIFSAKEQYLVDQLCASSL